jgi:uridine monophosphate synthetase
VGTSDPAILARVRRQAPERFLILRSLWAEEDRLDALLEAGLSPSADGLLLPLPQNLLVEDDMAERAGQLRERIEARRRQWLANQGEGDGASCSLWLPDSGLDGASAQDAGAAPATASLQLGGFAAEEEALTSLIIDLFDIGCLLFGDYVQASGAVFNYYIDLRQIISDPNLFHRVLHAYSGQLEGLIFDRIAGIPYGALPTATGLSLQLHKPLIYPRKEVKAHGARRLIEGDFEEGEQVVVIDDILISGGSVLDGIGKLTSSGLMVRDVVVFIDHGGSTDRSARRRLEQAGYRCHAVLDIARITAVLLAAGRLSLEQAVLLGHG